MVSEPKISKRNQHDDVRCHPHFQYQSGKNMEIMKKKANSRKKRGEKSSKKNDKDREMEMQQKRARNFDHTYTP